METRPKKSETQPKEPTQNLENMLGSGYILIPEPNTGTHFEITYEVTEGAYEGAWNYSIIQGIGHVLGNYSTLEALRQACLEDVQDSDINPLA